VATWSIAEKSLRPLEPSANGTCASNRMLGGKDESAYVNCVGVRVMVAARANWKGFIKFGEVAVAVALYTAASSSERVAFNTLNRAT
jgi:hypothetical protein